MPFDGNGNWSSTFSAVADRDANIKILASRFDNIFIDDIKNAFDNCVTRDGQGKATTATNANNYKVINVADPTNAQDAVNLRTLQSIWPVGSIYIGTQTTCPLATLISGSTWELVAEDKALWGGDGTNGNTTIAAGLPNITGNAVFNGVNYNVDSALNSASGAFTATTVSQTVKANGYSGANSSYAKKLTLDASTSSSIYGSSSTVQPPAYRVNVWRRTA